MEHALTYPLARMAYRKRDTTDAGCGEAGEKRLIMREREQMNCWTVKNGSSFPYWIATAEFDLRQL